MQSVLAERVLAQNNFLVPNGTFFVELIIFVIVLYVLGRYVVPPVREALAEREEMVRRQAEENQKAAEQFEAADARFKESMSEARGEAARIRDEARADARRFAEEQRSTAEAEIARIREGGEQELATQREAAVAGLRDAVGPLSSTLADRIIGSAGGEERDRNAAAEKFVAELDGGSSAVTAGKR